MVKNRALDLLDLKRLLKAYYRLSFKGVDMFREDWQGLEHIRQANINFTLQAINRIVNRCYISISLLNKFEQYCFFRA